MNYLKCPKCGSEDVFQKQNGNCLCGACGHRFVPQTAEKNFVPMRLFISYGHKESEICKRIYQALKVRGHQPWFDEEQIRFGHDWRERLAAGIEKSNSVVACLSQYSTREKGVCLDELAISVGVKGGNIVSILLDDVNPPSAVSHRQWLDMRDWEEKLDAGEDVFKPWFDAKMAELYAVLESEENREFSGQITELQNRLTIYYSTSRQAKLLRNSFVGRAWLNDAITNWLQDDTAPRTCLLTGAPGVGKSAYAAHFTHYNDHVAAALFCSSEMNTFNDPRTVIQTVAYLMACRLTAYRQSLMLHLPEDRAAVQRLSEKELFEQLISKPLSLSVNGNHERMVILLDGLDECGSPENNVLAKTLYEFADSLPDWLRILIVARDIPAISVYTKGAYRIEIGSESESNLEDIRTYYRFELESKFGDDPHWNDALERMTARSQGIFLYAQMLTDLLRSRGTLGAVEEYPDGLDAVFTSWFGWFFSDSDFRSFWRPAISCILGAPAPLPAETLRRVMHWGENELADFRARLKVLLRVEKNEFDEETLVFDHAFVREWLTRGAGENVYFCSPKDGAEKLTAELFSIFERGPEELSFWEAVHLMDLPLGERQREMVMGSHKLAFHISDVGKYYSYHGSLDESEKAHKKVILILKNIAEQNPSDENLKYLAVAYYLLGCTLQMEYRLIEALELFQKSLAIDEELSVKLGTPESLQDLAVSYDSIGDVLQIQGFPEKALKEYQKSLSIRKELRRKLDDPKSLMDLTVSYVKIGDVLQMQGNADSGLKLYLKSFSIGEELRQRFSTVEALPSLAISCNKIGDIFQNKGDDSKALKWFKKGLSIREKLNIIFKSPDSCRALSVSYNKIGVILQHQGNNDKALELFQKSLSICKELNAKINTPDSLNDLATVYDYIGGIWLDKDNSSKALELFQKSLSIDEQLSSRFSIPKFLFGLSASYVHIGDVFCSQKNFVNALEQYQKGLAVVEDLSKKQITQESKWCEMAICTRIVSALFELEKYAEAYPYAERALAISNERSSILGTDSARREEKNICSNLELLKSHLKNTQ